MIKDTRIDWRTVQTLVRSMPDLHKTLIIANVTKSLDAESNGEFVVEELAFTSGHALFRHKKNVRKQVGSQVKKQKI